MPTRRSTRIYERNINKENNNIIPEEIQRTETVISNVN